MARAMTQRLRLSPADFEHSEVHLPVSRIRIWTRLPSSDTTSMLPLRFVNNGANSYLQARHAKLESAFALRKFVSHMTQWQWLASRKHTLELQALTTGTFSKQLEDAAIHLTVATDQMMMRKPSSTPSHMTLPTATLQARVVSSTAKDSFHIEAHAMVLQTNALGTPSLQDLLVYNNVNNHQERGVVVEATFVASTPACARLHVVLTDGASDRIVVTDARDRAVLHLTGHGLCQPTGDEEEEEALKVTVSAHILLSLISNATAEVVDSNPSKQTVKVVDALKPAHDPVPSRLNWSFVLPPRYRTARSKHERRLLLTIPMDSDFSMLLNFDFSHGVGKISLEKTADALVATLDIETEAIMLQVKIGINVVHRICFHFKAKSDIPNLKEVHSAERRANSVLSLDSDLGIGSELTPSDPSGKNAASHRELRIGIRDVVASLAGEKLSANAMMVASATRALSKRVLARLDKAEVPELPDVTPDVRGGVPGGLFLPKCAELRVGKMSVLLRTATKEYVSLSPSTDVRQAVASDDVSTQYWTGNVLFPPSIEPHG
ncbi:MAG: hypothetical protein MHM6MM_008720, partial [Cercozoa sp. M6MM]